LKFHSTFLMKGMTMKKKGNYALKYSCLFLMRVNVMGIIIFFILVVIPNTTHATEFSVSNVAELIEAINRANDEIENPGTDTISLTTGIYLLKSIDNENDGPNGLPSISSKITIDGNQSTIKRGNDNQVHEFRIFHIENSGNLTLKDLTISNGHSPEGISGGGIYSRGILTLFSCNVLRNKAGDGIDGGFYGGDGGEGGGLFNNAAEVTIENSEFIGNRAGHGGFGNYGGDGGAGGSIVNYAGDVAIRNSKFIGNLAGGPGDGTQSKGHGGVGGGFANFQGKGAIEYSTFDSNIGLRGGGFFNSSGADFDVINCSFTNNYAYNGGGICNEGIMSIANSSIYRNDCDSSFGNGGGVHNQGTISITNSTISGNSSGGGIGNGGRATIKNSTITGNSGAGINAPIENPVEIQNSVIVLNTGYFVGNCNRGGAKSLGHNLVNERGECGYNPDIGDIFAANPMLGPLSDNGGPTLTHALLLESPAIDAGDNEKCPETDQRDSPRPVDGDNDGDAVCDIGSYEIQRCKGDFDEDGDMDGDDLYTQVDDETGVSIENFAEHFGRDNCPN
jgi:hypothetical protein